MRAFVLVRDVDVTGVSGTGVVAEGCEFEDGTTVLRWLPAGTTRPDRVKPTTVIHESVQSVINLHGHDNRTWVQFASDIVWPPVGEGRPKRLPAPPAEQQARWQQNREETERRYQEHLLGNKGGLDELEEADNDEEQDD